MSRRRAVSGISRCTDGHLFDATFSQGTEHLLQIVVHQSRKHDAAAPKSTPSLSESREVLIIEAIQSTVHSVLGQEFVI